MEITTDLTMNMSMDLTLDTLLRTAVGFVILFILTRLTGKKQIGQMNIFTYITGIALGNMAGDMVIHKDVRIIDGVVGMTIWCIFVLLIEYAGMKSAKTRVLLDGEPTIVIKKGKIIEKSLKKLRLNIDDLSMLLRLNRTFSILDIEYAILEPNGELSVMKKSMLDTVTKEDLKILAKSVGMPAEIIVDGKIVAQNLKELNFSNDKLNAELKKQGVKNVKNVLYAELQPDGSLYVQQRE